MANMGVISSLLERQDAIYQDRLNHASLLDGGLLSAAKFKRYRHNDSLDLQQQLKIPKQDDVWSPLMPYLVWMVTVPR